MGTEARETGRLDRVKLVEAANGCACLNFRKASRAITQFYDAALRPSGLRVTQYTPLVAVALAGSPTITQLAEKLVMDRTTLTRDLKLLERRGLVEIAPGADDRRTRVVRITEAGRQTLAEAVPLWEQAQHAVIEGLSQERWASMLTDLRDAVSLVHEGASPSRHEISPHEAGEGAVKNS
jgi:DNA-binding MarR family transcriptional regulator